MNQTGDNKFWVEVDREVDDSWEFFQHDIETYGFDQEPSTGRTVDLELD